MPKVENMSLYKVVVYVPLLIKVSSLSEAQRVADNIVRRHCDIKFLDHNDKDTTEGSASLEIEVTSVEEFHDWDEE